MTEERPLWALLDPRPELVDKVLDMHYGIALGDTSAVTGGEVAEETADIVTMDAEDKMSENKGGDVIGGEGIGDTEVKKRRKRPREIWYTREQISEL